jgi:hypothetical protein
MPPPVHFFTVPGDGSSRLHGLIPSSVTSEASGRLVVDLQPELNLARVVALVPHPSEAEGQSVAS